MRFPGTVISVAIALFVIYLLLGWVVDGYFDGDIVPNGATPDSWAAPSSWSNWRDIMIVFAGFFWMLAGLLLCVLLAVLVFLALQARRLMRDNLAPAIDSLKDSLDNVRGTTETVGENVVSPIIRVYSVMTGVKTGVSAITHLPDRIKRRKKGK